MPLPSPRLTPFGLQRGILEGSEVQAFAAVLAATHLAGGLYQIWLGSIAPLFDFG